MNGVANSSTVVSERMIVERGTLAGASGWYFGSRIGSLSGDRSEAAAGRCRGTCAAGGAAVIKKEQRFDSVGPVTTEQFRAKASATAGSRFGVGHHAAAKQQNLVGGPAKSLLQPPTNELRDLHIHWHRVSKGIGDRDFDVVKLFDLVDIALHARVDRFVIQR